MYSKNQQLPELKCQQLLYDLSFLADVMSHMNNLNLHLQRDQDVLMLLRSEKYTNMFENLQKEF